MNWVILVILLLVAICFYALGRTHDALTGISKRSSKKEQPDVLKVIEDVKFSNTIHPLVKHIYLLFVDKPDGYKDFIVDRHYMTIKSLDVSIWASNDAENRQFTLVPDELLKQYGMTMKELNKSMTIADLEILDTIVQRVKVNNKEFISRLFI